VSAQRHPRAQKRLGQHFLEPAWVGKLIDAIAPSAGDVFVEIGPGRGALTRPLAAAVARLVAVEIDQTLAAALAAELPPHARVVHADFLRVAVATLLEGISGPVRVAGNLPYNAASPMLFKLLAEAREGRGVADATLMVQREVADRLAARPGSPDYSGLTVHVSLAADVDRLLSLPPGAFRPVPKVSSSVVRLRFRAPLADPGDPLLFSRLVREVFSQRRKTIQNALRPFAKSRGRSAAQVLEQLALDPTLRPQDLTPADYAALCRAVL
jgi:16S rRNA (adenine1518-N6/adenine1519-N6)-dimethyltransferase